MNHRLCLHASRIELPLQGDVSTVVEVMHGFELLLEPPSKCEKTLLAEAVSTT